MTSTETTDVVVIGAGLAGLRAAARLAQAGHDVVVLEQADAVGGRQRTDVVDGFRLDRGLQILNPAYPAVRRWVDVDALELRRFPVGVRVVRDGSEAELWHPLRHPARIPTSLASGLIAPRDLVGLIRWLAPVMLRPRAVIAGRDEPLGARWDRDGLRGPLRREVLEPFLAGVLADDRGDTSAAFTALLMRMFALGAPGVPAQGIAALPAQLARTAAAAGARIRPGMRVVRTRRAAGGIEVDIAAAAPLRGRAAVLAVGPEGVARLADVPQPATKGLRTWWFEADAEAPASALLTVDGRRRGPIVNSVVMSRSAPTYAPPGCHLVEATCLYDDDPDERRVRRQLSEMWHTDTRPWRLLRRDDIPHALPAQPAPLRTTSPARIGDGLYVAGDHRDTASIQGALVSGERAARAVLADLGTARAARNAG